MNYQHKHVTSPFISYVILECVVEIVDMNYTMDNCVGLK